MGEGKKYYTIIFNLEIAGLFEWRRFDCKSNFI